MIHYYAQPCSDRLLAILRTRNDDGQPELVVAWQYDDADGADLTITRADGSEPSPSEEAHIMATLAANRVEPI